MKKIHIAITGLNRYPGNLLLILKELAEAKKFLDIDVVIGAWRHESSTFNNEILGIIKSSEFTLLFEQDDEIYNSFGQYTRQIFLLKKTIHCLQKKYQASEEDYVLKIRGDVVFSGNYSLTRLIQNLQKKLCIELEHSIKLWTPHVDLIEPYYACDIVYCARLGDLLKVDEIPFLEVGSAMLLGYAGTEVRPEVSFFSRLFGIEMSTQYLEILNSEDYRVNFNSDKLTPVLLGLLKNENYLKELLKWHDFLASVSVGLSMATNDILLLRDPPKENKRSLMLGCSNVDWWINSFWSIDNKNPPLIN